MELSVGGRLEYQMTFINKNIKQINYCRKINTFYFLFTHFLLVHFFSFASKMGLLDQLFARKRKMRNVAIVGANSLLGQHLFNRLLNSPTSHQISVWTHGSKFVNRLEGAFIFS